MASQEKLPAMEGRTYMAEKNNTIWTFGHSTRSPEEFIAAL